MKTLICSILGATLLNLNLAHAQSSVSCTLNRGEQVMTVSAKARGFTVSDGQLTAGGRSTQLPQNLIKAIEQSDEGLLSSRISHYRLEVSGLKQSISVMTSDELDVDDKLKVSAIFNNASPSSQALDSLRLLALSRKTQNDLTSSQSEAGFAAPLSEVLSHQGAFRNLSLNVKNQIQTQVRTHLRLICKSGLESGCKDVYVTALNVTLESKIGTLSRCFEVTVAK